MPRLRALEWCAIAAALVTLAVMATQAPGGHGLLLGNGQPMFGDFLAFWSAGRLALRGDVNLVHDQAALIAMHREAVPGLEKFFPWRSPPPFLLVAAPLAMLPYAIAALVFLAATLGLYLAALRKLLTGARGLLFAVATPTAMLQIGSVQLSFAITGFTALAAAWLERRPLAAGAAIAAMIVKPHLAILWPILLIVQRRWRVFFAASMGTLSLLALAGLAFGFDSYARFFADLGAAHALVAARGLPPNTLASLYAALLYLGAPNAIALAAHGVFAIAALALCIPIWKRADARLSIAGLAAATLLMSPYLFFYDTLLLAVSVALMARPEERVGAVALYALAFLAGALSLWLGLLIPLPICPLASAALLGLCARRAGVFAGRNAQPA